MRRRVLISILLVIAATVLTLGVPLSIVSWRVVDDLMHTDLSSRLESIAASIANQSGSSEIDLGQLEAAVPTGGRLDIRMAGRIDQSIGTATSDQVYSEQLAMSGGGTLRLAVPESYLRAEQWKALALVGSRRRRGRGGTHGSRARTGDRLRGGDRGTRQLLRETLRSEVLFFGYG